MKPHTPEYAEGPEAAERFQNVMRAVIAVPHAEIQVRIAEHKRETANNPKRRGPKRKTKPSASPGSAV